MQNLQIQSMTEIAHSNDLPLKEAQAPGIVNQWRRQLDNGGLNARTGKPLTPRQRRYFQSKLDAYDKANQDPNAFGSGIPGIATDPVQNSAAPQNFQDDLAIPQIPQDPSQAIQALMQSAKQFGSQFNNEIRSYNQHIKQVHQSISMLQGVDWNTSSVDASRVVQQAVALQQTLENATEENAQDIAFMQQLATQAAQLAQSASGASMTMEEAHVAPQQPELAPQMGIAADQSNLILTASMGSAQSIYNSIRS